MNASNTAIGWQTLGAVEPGALADARLQAHHAVQLLTRAARGYLPAAADDSHTNLGWDTGRGRFVGRPVTAASPQVQLALNVPNLTLELSDPDGGPAEDFPLHGRTLEEAASWVKLQFVLRGLDPAPFDQPLHFEIPAHPVATSGAKFDAEAASSALAELARYYTDAQRSLAEILDREPGASELRCWPHHFDLGALIDLSGGKSIGLGLSPGDHYYDEPYYYVNPYPTPDNAGIAPLARGHWHTHEWFGGVAAAHELLEAAREASAQQIWTREFLSGVLAALKTVLR